MCGYFNVEDLFAAGIGFDIGGACLVALGLLTAPRQIADFMDLHKQGNAYLGLAVIDDKINGESGAFFSSSVSYYRQSATFSRRR